MTTSVNIVDGARSPFLKARATVGPFSASDLAVNTARQLVLRSPFKAEEIDQVVVGCTMPSENEANIARIIALRIGCGQRVPGWTVQRNCASGMQALDCAKQAILSGESDIILAGGVDTMSRAPVVYNEAMVNWLGRWMVAKSFPERLKVLAGFRLSHLAPILALLKGLTDPVVGLSMGQTAENLAYRFQISRREMDDYSVQSHRRLLRAQNDKDLTEIVPLIDAKGRIYAADDGVRPDSHLDKLAKLKPFFDKKYGLVTPGNSSQITDGASFLILASDKAVHQYGLKVRAKIVDCEWAALDPAIMGLGPVYASTALLKRNKLTRKDIDFWEVNEAFAAQVLACLRACEDPDFCVAELGMSEAFGAIDQQHLNVDGGAISMGHPIGASGARVVLHLMHVLERENARMGVASLCVGGGQGGAMLIERKSTGGSKR